MDYRLLEGESVADSLRRIAAEQIVAAGEDIDGADDDVHEAVHEFRKRCKKIRGLIRLVRPGFPAYAEENAWFRDRAGELSALRDATSMQECLDALIDHYGDGLGEDPFPGVRQWLARRRENMTDEEALARLRSIRADLPRARERVGAWELDHAGPETVAAGVRKTYKRARKAMRAAGQDATARSYHEWRKRVKYYRYQLHLLAPLWPPVMGALHDETERLSDLLGDDHDLAVLGDTLVQERGTAAEHEALLALIARRSRALRDEALSLGHRLFALGPRAQAHWVRALLERWQDETAR